jgi:hypothetical protein
MRWGRGSNLNLSENLRRWPARINLSAVLETLSPTMPANRSHPTVLFVSLVCAALLAGCAALRPAKVPVDVVVDPAPPSRGSKVLIVFLPGAWDTPADVVAQGFIRQVRERNIAADVAVVDLHLRYFLNRTMLERLDRDVIGPALARGYAQIWFAGISMGGLGSLLYASSADGQPRPPVAGVLALAPFIADRSVMREVTDAGGLARWRPAEPIEGRDYSRRLLQWMQGYANGAQPRPPLFLGYGAEDGYAETVAMLGDVLPRERLFTAPGGHDWPPWLAMWGAMLDRAPLPRVVTPQ